MTRTLYIIDAFASTPFTGNPAGVCLLDHWLPEKVMQNIAMENNQAETAFVVRNENSDFHIRWFTPTVEVDLCGHATLASAFAIFNFTEFNRKEIIFDSRSGPLRVRRENGLLILNFPTDEISPATLPEEITNPLGKPVATFKGKTDYMVVFNTQKEIEAMQPDFAKIAKAEARGIIVTAPGNTCDFVSRFFAPQAGVNEDPVTGSAHTTLTPYWSQRLSKKKLIARQLSRRGGDLICENLGDRTEIGGKAVLYLKGSIEV